jgi:lipoprotein-releasing system permease protein
MKTFCVCALLLEAKRRKSVRQFSGVGRIRPMEWKKNMRFEDFVGLRYLMAKRDRNMLSVITLISIGGVSVGVMALIVVLSVMGGFEADFREKIIGSKAHVVVSADEGYLENYNAIMDRIRRLDRVEGVNAYVEAEVMLNSPTNLQVAILRGINSHEITTTTKLAEYMK